MHSVPELEIMATTNSRKRIDQLCCENNWLKDQINIIQKKVY